MVSFPESSLTAAILRHALSLSVSLSEHCPELYSASFPLRGKLNSLQTLDVFGAKGDFRRRDGYIHSEKRENWTTYFSSKSLTGYHFSKRSSMYSVSLDGIIST